MSAKKECGRGTAPLSDGMQAINFCPNGLGCRDT